MAGWGKLATARAAKDQSGNRFGSIGGTCYPESSREAGETKMAIVGRSCTKEPLYRDKIEVDNEKGKSSGWKNRDKSAPM